MDKKKKRKILLAQVHWDAVDMRDRSHRRQGMDKNRGERDRLEVENPFGKMEKTPRA